LLISARSESALRILLRRHRELIGQSTASITSICRSSRTAREHYEYRAALLATSAEQMACDIDGVLKGQVPTSRVSGFPAPCLVLDGNSVLSPETVVTYSRLSEAFKVALDQALQHGASMAFAHQFAWATMWIDWGATPRLIVVDGLGREVEAVLAGTVQLAEALRRPIQPVATAAQRNAHWRVVEIAGVSSLRQEDITAQVDGVLREVTGQSPITLLSLAQCPELARGSAADIRLEIARLFGALYMAGATLPWAKLPGGRGSKVSLPGHPFERTAYWHPWATAA